MTPASNYTPRDTNEEEMLVSRRAPRYDLPKAAPDELRHVQLLVNPTDHETGRELRDSPRGLGDWLAEQRLLRPGARIRPLESERIPLLRVRISSHKPPLDQLLHAHVMQQHLAQRGLDVDSC